MNTTTTTTPRIDTSFTYGRYTTAAPGAGIGTMRGNGETLAELGKKAGLTTWKINSAFVRYPLNRDGSMMRTDKTKKVMFRSDNGEALGVVGANYKPVHPGELFDTITTIADTMGAEVSTCGMLDNGKKLFVSAKMPGGFDIGGDETRPFVMISTGTDGSLSTEARWIADRIACANMVEMLIKSRPAVYKLSHRSKFNAADLITAVTEANTAFANHRSDMEKLAGWKVSADEAAMIVAGLLNPKAVNLATGACDGEHIDKVRESKEWAMIMGLFSGAGKGAMLDSTRGTGYGVLNAVTEFYDHHSRARTDENRFKSATYGKNRGRKTEAVTTLLTLATA